MSGIKLYGLVIFFIIILSTFISHDSSANLNINSLPSSESNILKEITSNLNPVLMEYKVNKSTEIWSANEPSQYITPGDGVVQWQSKQLKLLKVNESIIIIQHEDGTPLNLNYVRDLEQFGVDDYWINPSYYLTHTYNGKTLSGDCEDSALAMTSILIAKGYNTVTVLGYVKKNDGSTGRHAWAETTVDGKTFVVDGNLLYEKSYFQTTHDWTPRYMWNDIITFRDYSTNWS